PRYVTAWSGDALSTNRRIDRRPDSARATNEPSLDDPKTVTTSYASVTGSRCHRAPRAPAAQLRRAPTGWQTSRTPRVSGCLRPATSGRARPGRGPAPPAPPAVPG